MENKESFKLTYSAKQQEEVQAIRKKYIPQETDKMEQLRALDEGVTKKATMFSILVGLAGTLIMGAGMSLFLSDFGNFLGSYGLLFGIVIGSIGIIILAFAYPLYNLTLKKEREKIAPEILRLTDDLLQNHQ